MIKKAAVKRRSSLITALYNQWQNMTMIWYRENINVTVFDDDDDDDNDDGDDDDDDENDDDGDDRLISEIIIFTFFQ